MFYLSYFSWWKKIGSEIQNSRSTWWEKKHKKVKCHVILKRPINLLSAGFRSGKNGCVLFLFGVGRLKKKPGPVAVGAWGTLMRLPSSSRATTVGDSSTNCSTFLQPWGRKGTDDPRPVLLCCIGPLFASAGIKKDAGSRQNHKKGAHCVYRASF